MTEPTTAFAPGRLPALFVSHGTPMLGFEDADEPGYTRSLRLFVRSLPARPKAVVVVSSYGLSPDRTVMVNAASRPRVMHDFRGFPSSLYQIEYAVPGSPELAVKVVQLLSGGGFEASLSTGSGLDHGAWMPLRAAFPEADVPIVQLSLPFPSQPERILQLGRSLASLRDEGVLLVGSGGVVHNFEQLVWHGKHGPAAAWATEFDDWVRDRLEHRDVASLCDFVESGPSARLAQPSREHFYPLFFMLGASAPGDGLHSIYGGIQYSSLSMSSFALMPPGLLLH